MNKKFVAELATTIAKLDSPSSVIEFLQGILTPKELDEISVRLQIVKRLKAGEPQRSIAQDLGVGVATITRGSREIQQGRFKNV